MHNYLYYENKENLEQLFETLPEKFQGILIGMDIMLKKIKEQQACLVEEREFVEDTLEKIRCEVKLQGMGEVYDFLEMELYENFLAFLER